MVKRKVSLLYLLLLPFLALPPPARGWSGTVIDVAAGDTITVLRGEQPVRVRLYGIDCPEEGQPFGTEAKQFTATMVLGKMVEVGAINVDHYGRTVSLVYLDGKGVCDELIRAGLAWVYYLYCNLPICAEWKNLESEAKKAKRLLWSNPEPISPWRLRRQKRK
ncbi:MAG: thermonuclease family protein [Syntrophobacterales bacterium]